MSKARKKEISERMDELQQKGMLTKDELKEYDDLSREYDKLWSDTLDKAIPYVPEKYQADVKRPPKMLQSSTARTKQSMREDMPYTCKHCGETFQKFHELGVHRRQEIAYERQAAFKQHQLSRIPKELPIHCKEVNVTHLGTSTRIASTFFIPSEWHRIRIYEPIKEDYGIWIFILPIILEKSELAP